MGSWRVLVRSPPVGSARIREVRVPLLLTDEACGACPPQRPAAEAPCCHRCWTAPRSDCYRFLTRSGCQTCATGECGPSVSLAPGAGSPANGRRKTLALRILPNYTRGMAVPGAPSSPGGGRGILRLLRGSRDRHRCIPTALARVPWRTRDESQGIPCFIDPVRGGIDECANAQVKFNRGERRVPPSTYWH